MDKPVKDQSRFKLWIGLFIVLIISAYLFLAAFGFLNLPIAGLGSNRPTANDLNTTAEPASGVDPSLSAATPLPSGPSINSNDLTDADRAQIDRCLRETQDLRDFQPGQEGRPLSRLSELLNRQTPVEKTFEYQNVHIRRPDGETRRLQVIPSDSPDGNERSLQVRVFSADAEGLPVLEDLPEELAGLAPEQAVAQFKTQGEVILDEVSQSLRWSDERSGRFVSRNGEVLQMELFLADQALLCDLEAVRAGASAEACRCMSRREQ